MCSLFIFEVLRVLKQNSFVKFFFFETIIGGTYIVYFLLAVTFISLVALELSLGLMSKNTRPFSLIRLQSMEESKI